MPYTLEELQAAVQEHGGKAQAARALGLPRTTLRRQLQVGRVYSYPTASPEEAYREIIGDKQHPERKRKLTADEVMQVAKQLLEEKTQTLPAIDIKVPHHEPGQGDEEDMVAFFSDLQTGHRTVTTNAEVLRERVRRYAHKVLAIAKLHRKLYPIRRLWVPTLGDMVQNELIGRFVSLDDLESVVGDQYIQASDAFAEFLSILAPHFDDIQVPCVRGNHGQAQEYAADRTSWDDVVYERTRLLLQNQKNIHFAIAERFFQIVEIRAHKFLLVHGDQIPSSMNIPLYGITNRGMRWQGSLGQFDYLAIGHFHNTCEMDWNNTEILMNGCFVTDDEWVAKRLGFASQARQLCFGVHDRHGITWRYKLDLKEES